MVRPLSKELQKLAIEELHEDPDKVKEEIEHMKKWIKQQLYLKARTDEQWILAFLRGCKFNLEKTKERFDRYYTLKSLIPELMQSRDVHSLEIQAMLKAGFLLPLPYSASHKGPRVILIRWHNLDANTTTVENLAVLLHMILTILMIEDDNFIVSGVLFWNELSGMPFSMISQFTPKFGKHFFECLQNAFPLRVKGIHLSGSYGLISKIVMLMKSNFGPKLKHRVFMYNDDNFETIFNAMPKRNMPKEYGGEISNLEEIQAHWKGKVESYSSWFKANNQYSTIESMRPGKPATLDDIIGNYGSFEKLNID